MARDVLLRLADIGEGSPERRLVSLSEVKVISGVQRVLAALDRCSPADGRGGHGRALARGAATGVAPLPRLARGGSSRRARCMRTFVLPRRNGTCTGRDPGDLYRGARLAAALEFRSQHADWIDRLEREFVGSSQLETDREAERQRVQNRRLRALLVAGAVLLVLTAVAGVVAVVGQQRASRNAQLADAAARAALGRQLGAEALGEQRLDVAALLAREGVALDRSPQTEGTLLTTLLRSPAVLGTFPLPTDSTPHVAVSPDGRTLVVSDSVAGSVQFYDARTRVLQPRRLRDFVGDQSPVYSADGSLLVYTSGGLGRARRTDAGPARAAHARASVQAAAGRGHFRGQHAHSARRAHRVLRLLADGCGRSTRAGLPRQLGACPAGRQLGTIRLGSGPLVAVRLLDRGTRLDGRHRA